MESPSNLRSLSQTLALKKSQDQNAVASVTHAELEKLGSDLQRQSSAVLTTTALSITQSASREMQSAGQQLAPQIDQIREELSTKLAQMQEQIVPAVTLMQSDVSAKLAQMQQQIDQQLQPLDAEAMKQRMGKIQGQINAQTKPLIAALEKVKTESEALSAMTAKAWLKPVLISVMILASISLPAWGLIHYLASQVQRNLVLIQQQEQTLVKLQAATFGVELKEDQHGKFLILPDGMELASGWTFGGKPALKLSKK